MHEDVVHLHEGKQHVQHRIDAKQNVPVFALRIDLEEMDKL